jgi:hypothetical protein
MTQFSVDLSNFTEVHTHDTACNSSDCICLPPLTMLDTEYRCHPAPKNKPNKVPVIGPDRLTHYFLHPECIDATQKTTLSQLPKRICGRLTPSPNDEAVGWGLHFREGWHWRTVYGLVVLLVVLSLVFGILWSVARSNIQEGFAISGYLATVGSLWLGYLVLRGQ